MTDESESVAQLATRLREAGCLLPNEEARLLVESGATGARLSSMIDRRLAGEPVETVLGWVDFVGQRLVVQSGVFVPRRRTQLLAQTCLDLVPDTGVLVELCCGVAPVAAVVMAGAPTVEVHVADVSGLALECAQENVPLASHHQGDLYAALPDHLLGRVSVIAANAPHVPTAEMALMPREALAHEPRRALDGGPEGTQIQRLLVAEAAQWLAPAGVIALESGPDAADQVTTAMREVGLGVEVRDDPAVHGCVVLGFKPGERA